MKLFLLPLFFALSLPAHAAPLNLYAGDVGNPFIGYSAGCSIFSCSASVYDPYIIIPEYNDTGSPLPDTDRHFYSGNDLVLREMEMSAFFYVSESVSGTVEWGSQDLFGYGEMYLFDRLINLETDPFGSFEISFSENSYVSTYIMLAANTLDAYGSWRLTFNIDDPTPPIETPIPASLLLFAPALLGLIGIRRKLS